METTLYATVKLVIEHQEIDTEDLVNVIGSDVDYSFTMDGSSAAVKIIDTELLDVCDKCPLDPESDDEGETDSDDI